MAETVPLKFYKYQVNGQTYYDVLPQYGNIAGKTLVTDINEINTAIDQYSSKTDEWSQNYVNTLKTGIQQVQSGSSPYVLNDQGILATKEEVAEQQDVQQKLASGGYTNLGTTDAPLLVPIGTPDPKTVTYEQSLAGPAGKIPGVVPSEPSPIPVSSLQETTSAINLPSQSSDSNNYQSIINSPIPTYQSSQSDDGSIPDYLKKFLDDSKAPKNPLEDYTELEKTLGISSKEAEVLEKKKAVSAAQNEFNMVQSQLQAINDETKAEQLKTENKLLPMGVIQRKNVNLEREAAIRALPLQAKALMAQAKIASTQGDLNFSQELLDNAKDRLNTLFQIQVGYNEQLYNYEQAKVNAVYEYASAKEKEQLDQMKLQDSRNFQLFLNNINYARDLSAQAIDNG